MAEGRHRHRAAPTFARAGAAWGLAIAVAIFSLFGGTPASAQHGAPDNILAPALSAIVRVHADTGEADAGRSGSGIVIDATGLVLTVSYLVVEARTVMLTRTDGRTVPALPVAFDHASGLALLRPLRPLGVEPVELGSSAGLQRADDAFVASWDGGMTAIPAKVVSRQTFVGGWEYILEDAIFAVPPYPALGGAALLSAEGRLIGVGALIVADGTGPDQGLPSNMFVPIDRLKPVLADLLESGRPAGPAQPWIGVLSEEVHGRLLVTGVTAGSPAHAAGIRPGDLVLGIGGTAVTALDEFYRRLWAAGAAGTTVPLDVLQGHEVRQIAVRSTDRHDFLRPNRNY